LLICVLTVAFSLGLNVWTSVGAYLSQCEAEYTTIGLLEYMGPDYPDETVYDARFKDTVNSFDYSLITGNRNVQAWDASARALGYVNGFTRTDTLVPCRESAVLVVGDIEPYVEESMCTGVVLEALYSSKDMKNKLILFDRGDQQFEEGHAYVMNGEYYQGRTAYPYIMIEPYDSAAARAAGIEADETTMLADVTDADGGWSIDPDSVFSQIAETYRMLNNSVSVYATGALDSMFDFQQQTLYITRGRSFTQQEYDSGERVCVVSEALAQKCGVDVGGEITLSIAVLADSPVYETYWAGTGFASEQKYTIVGLTNSTTDMSHAVFIPKNGDVDYTLNPIGNTIGQVVLRNNGADAFYSEVAPQLPDRVRLTIYDQGYGAVAEPFQDILRIAIIVTCVTGLLCLAVIVMFGYLFVYRQRDASEIMIQLGAGRWRVCRYFLYGSGLIGLFSTGAGAAAGYGLSGFVSDFVSRVATGYVISDTRFSNGDLTIAKTVTYVPDIGFTLFALAAAAILAAVLLSCLAFTLRTFRPKNPRRPKRKTIKKVGRSANLTGGPLKYALLSILRGGVRSAVVPALALAAVMFFGQLAQTAQSYEDRLTQIQADTVLSGCFTNIHGKQVRDLTLEAFDLNNLSRSGYVTQLNVAKAIPYMYWGRYDENGQLQYSENAQTPTTDFAMETFIDKLMSGPRLVMTNDIASAPEFFYSVSVKTDYMDGYDASVLSAPLPDDGVPCCLVSTDFMEQSGVQYGDTIDVVWYGERRLNDTALRVVGSFERQGSKDNIYCQLSYFVDPEVLFAGGDSAQLYPYTFDSASFKVPASHLGEFKDYLSGYGYSDARHIGSVRAFVLLEDKIFNDTVDTLTQQNRYIRALYPCLYALTGIIGMLVAFLLVAGRKSEYAIMRGLGARRIIPFLSLFTEQALLCIAGLALGIGVWVLAGGGANPLQLLLTAGFALCYLLGSAVSGTVLGRVSALSLLSDEE
jgi:ABC-type lipoprotein release transport system permease subunit